MGLLSDPEYGSVKWVKLLKKVHGPLCFLCYVGALVWFVMLGNKEFNNETYFSENALLPGLVTNEFNAEHSAKRFFTDFITELEDKYEDSEEMPVPWLVAKMSQLYLEVYTHNFTLNYPMGQGQVYRGTNVYGVLRAARTASREALVLAAPYRPLMSHEKGTAAGIALMLAFAEFARPQKYWAKDIIFLITEHEQLGMQAWLEAYHGLNSDSETFYTSLGSFWKPGSPKFDFSNMAFFDWGMEHQKCLDPGKLKGRSGSIQAAINLEFHTPKIKYIEVKVEGLNGQLPNLDLVNLVHKLCVKSGIHHSYKNSYSWIRPRNKYDEWSSGVRTMLAQAAAQLAGVGHVPSGNHGLFHRFGIEAVTLEGRDAGDATTAPPRVSALSTANFYRLGIALESIFRSLNNLLESFHQSYFFYLLAATNRFVSIGQYMPSLCLLCAALVVRALSLWVSLQDAREPARGKRTASDAGLGHRDKKDSPKKSPETSDDGLKGHDTKKPQIPSDEVLEEHEKKPRKNHKQKVDTSMSIVNIGANYILVHLIGYLVMNSPMVFSKIGALCGQPSEVAVYGGLLAASAALALLALLAPRWPRWPRRARRDVALLNILALVELATVCLTVGMHNFPLGLTLAAAYTPLALAVGTGTTRFSLFVKRAFCLLLSPLWALTLCTMLYSRLLFPEDALLSALGRGRDAAMQAVMFSVVDSLIYGNWLFNVMSAAILPVWIIFWQILCNPVEEQV